MKTILVPTDYSANARNAMLYAATLAKRMEAKLLLVHAFQLPVLISETLAERYQEKELIREHTNKLIKLADDLSAEYRVTVQQMACEGNLPDVLARLVKEKEVDLVVMGIQDMSRAERLLAGSMTATILKQANYPVLVVPFTTSFNPIQRIVFACQYDYLCGKNMVPHLKEIAQAYNAEVEILRIEDKEGELENIQDRIKTGHYLELLFKGIRHSYRFLNNRHILEGIECEVQESQADMLVMVPRKHTLWDYLLNRSTTQQMLFHTNVPLLALPNPN